MDDHGSKNDDLPKNARISTIGLTNLKKTETQKNH